MPAGLQASFDISSQNRLQRDIKGGTLLEMKITLNHPASLNGIPAILDDDGQAMPYSDGIRKVLSVLQLKPAQAAEFLGVSARTVYDWQEDKTQPNARVLNLLMLELEDLEKAKR